VREGIEMEINIQEWGRKRTGYISRSRPTGES